MGIPFYGGRCADQICFGWPSGSILIWIPLFLRLQFTLENIIQEPRIIEGPSWHGVWVSSVTPSILLNMVNSKLKEPTFFHWIKLKDKNNHVYILIIINKSIYLFLFAWDSGNAAFKQGSFPFRQHNSTFLQYFL